MSTKFNIDEHSTSGSGTPTVTANASVLSKPITSTVRTFNLKDHSTSDSDITNNQIDVSEDADEFYKYNHYIEGLDTIFQSNSADPDWLPDPPKGYVYHETGVPTVTGEDEADNVYTILKPIDETKPDERLDTTTKKPTWRWVYDSYTNTWKKADLPKWEYDPLKESKELWQDWEYADWDTPFLGSRLKDQVVGAKHLNKFILDRGYDLGWAFNALLPMSPEDESGSLLPDTAQYITKKLYENPEYVEALPFGFRHIVQKLMDKGTENGKTIYEASEYAGDILRETLGASLEAAGYHGSATYYSVYSRQPFEAIKNNKRIANVTAKIEADKKLSELVRGKVTPTGAWLRERELALKADELAEETVTANRDLKEQLIRDFEETTGKTISKKGTDDKLEIDFDLAIREAGEEATETIAARSARLQVEGPEGDLVPLFSKDESLVNPLLQPETFNNMIAVIAELRKTNPKAFNPKNKVIEDLINLTVQKDLLGDPNFIKILNKYNVSFEDYILSISYSGHKAGQILNKLSQMKRTKGFMGRNNQHKLEVQDRLESQNIFMKGVRRWEAARRGGLVSQIATMSRNLMSFGIRMPAQAFVNIMDNTLYQIGKHGVLGSSKNLITGHYNPIKTFQDSFRQFKYVYSGTDALEAHQWVNYMLKRPELKEIHDTLYNTLNEIRKVSKIEYETRFGRGFDNFMNVYEDFVDMLNIPNRWQEHLARNASFLSESERLIRREWGVDLIEDIFKKGKLKAALNDSPEFKPSGARSFMDIMLEAQDTAMDVTYGSAPEFVPFRIIADTITNVGGTAIVEFPRFMFKSIELMAKFVGGASIPVTKTVFSPILFGRKANVLKNASDRKLIGYNIAGWTMALAAYQMRTAEDAPADYKQLNIVEGVELDTTPQFYMRPFLWIGEAMGRAMDGTLDQWEDMGKEFLETFIGTNYRVGVINSFVKNVRDGIFGEDVGGSGRAGKITGEMLGNYINTILVPLGQAIELERATGERGLEYKELRERPSLKAGETLHDKFKIFAEEFGRGLRQPQRRLTISAEDEAALEEKEYLFGKRRRVGPLWRVGFGLNMKTTALDDGEYLRSLGFTEYGLGSKSFVPEIQSVDNQILRDIFIPSIIKEAKLRETPKYRQEYREANSLTKSRETEVGYINKRLKEYITKRLKKARAELHKYRKDDSYTKYMRTPVKIRNIAMSEYIRLKGRLPDFSKKGDMIDMLNVIKQVRKRN